MKASFDGFQWFEKASEEVSSGYGNSHPRILKEILDNLYNGLSHTPVSGTEALEAVKIVQAIYASEEKKNWVELEENPISSKLGNWMVENKFPGKDITEEDIKTKFPLVAKNDEKHLSSFS